MSDYHGSFPLHDVDDVPAYCRGLLKKRLPRIGARLSREQREDALAFLIATAWELSRDYRVGVGTFRGYLSKFLPLRLNDWFEKELKQLGHYSTPVEDELERAERSARAEEGDDGLPSQRRAVPASLILDEGIEEYASPDDAIALLIDELVPLSDASEGPLRGGRKFIVGQILTLIADGHSYEDVGRRYGKSRKWTERAVAEVRQAVLDVRARKEQETCRA